MSGCSKQANGRAGGPVLTYRFLAVLNYSTGLPIHVIKKGLFEQFTPRGNTERRITMDRSAFNRTVIVHVSVLSVNVVFRVEKAFPLQF